MTRRVTIRAQLDRVHHQGRSGCCRVVRRQAPDDVLNAHKVWARGPMPPSLDEALDYLSAEYAIQMPTADLLYRPPTTR